MPTAVDDDDLRITFEQGSEPLAVVAFTGISHRLGGVGIEEFKKSLVGSHGPSASVIFVADMKRRWYNHGLGDRIAMLVNNLIDNLGALRSVTLGNSMGGSGAIILARRLKYCAGAVSPMLTSLCFP